jgi:hypothetical protein
MKQTIFSKLLEFLQKLRDAKIAFTLRGSRDDAIMVQINVPGERWEVEFLEEGSIEVERFRSNGEIEDEAALEELFAILSEPPAPEAVASNDASTGK